MTAFNLDLLKRLCETPGVPGREHRVRALIEAELEGLVDESYTDPMGSLLTVKRATETTGETPLKVMLLCHMDEIGFLVSHISDQGFVHVDPVGGFDPRNLFSRRVLVCTGDGDLKGVMNATGKPIHTASADERKKIPEPTEFFIDLGLDGDTAKEKIRVGDYVVMDEPLIEMGDKIVSKALDNRIACWLGLEVLRALKASGASHACDIHVAFTAQEEVGLRGARTASYAVKPDIGFGVDTTLAVDTPGVPADARVTKQGDGFGLKIKDGSFIGDLGLIEEIEALAETRDIPFQRCILSRGGQDGAAAQQAAAGARAVGIVVGTRYIHTVTETIDKGDLEAARDILVAYLETH